MQNNKVIKIIIVLMLIILLLISILFKELKMVRRNAAMENLVEYVWQEEKSVLEPKPLKSNSEYYTIYTCVNNYFRFVIRDITNKQYVDEWYKKGNNILTEEFLKGFTSYEPDKIKYLSKDKVYIYIVEGEIVFNEGKKESKKYNLIVKLDYNNYRYSIIPEITEDIYTDQNIFKQIRDQRYDVFRIRSIPNVTIAQRYLNNFFISTLKNIEESYKFIEPEYKQKKFNNNIETYKQLINNEFNYIGKVKPIIEECKVIEYDLYTIYIATDKQNNSFVIKENAVNDFYLMLDDETIKVEEIK